MDFILIIFFVISQANGHIFIYVKRDSTKITEDINKVFDSDEKRQVLEDRKNLNTSESVQNLDKNIVKDINNQTANKIERDYYYPFEPENKLNNINEKSNDSVIIFDLLDINTKKKDNSSKDRVKKCYYKNKKRGSSGIDKDYDFLSMNTDNYIPNYIKTQEQIENNEENYSDKLKSLQLMETLQNIEEFGTSSTENSVSPGTSKLKHSTKHNKSTKIKYTDFLMKKKKAASAIRRRMVNDSTKSKLLLKLLSEPEKHWDIPEVMRSRSFMKIIRSILNPDAIRSILYHGLRMKSEDVSHNFATTSTIKTVQNQSDNEDDVLDDEDTEDDEEDIFCQNGFNPLCLKAKQLSRMKRDYSPDDDEYIPKTLKLDVSGDDLKKLIDESEVMKYNYAKNKYYCV